MGMGTFFSIRLPAFNRVNLALLVGSQSLHPIVAKSFFPDDFIVMLPTVCSFGEKEKDKEGNEKKDSVNFDLIIACKTAVIMLIPKNTVTTPASPSLFCFGFAMNDWKSSEVTRSV